jgi:hypothetical protein
MAKLDCKLHMPFWSRLKHLLVIPIQVHVEAKDISNVSVYIAGEDSNLVTVVKLSYLEQ